MAIRDIARLHDTLERAAYQLRWQDLNLTVLMPIAAGLFEQNYHATTISPDEERLIELVGKTATRHATRMTITGDPVGVVVDGSLSDWLVPCVVDNVRNLAHIYMEAPGGRWIGAYPTPPAHTGALTR